MVPPTNHVRAGADIRRATPSQKDALTGWPVGCPRLGNWSPVAWQRSGHEFTTSVGTRVHYVAVLAPLVSLVMASITLLAGRVLRAGSRLTAAKVALGLDLTFFMVAFLVVLKMAQNIDG